MDKIAALFSCYALAWTTPLVSQSAEPSSAAGLEVQEVAAKPRVTLRAVLSAESIQTDSHLEALTFVATNATDATPRLAISTMTTWPKSHELRLLSSEAGAGTLDGKQHVLKHPHYMSTEFLSLPSISATESEPVLVVGRSKWSAGSARPALMIESISTASLTVLDVKEFHDDSTFDTGWEMVGWTGTTKTTREFTIVGPCLVGAKKQDIARFELDQAGLLHERARVSLEPLKTRGHAKLAVHSAKSGRQTGIVLDVERKDSFAIGRWSYPDMKVGWTVDVAARDETWWGSGEACSVSDVDGLGESDVVVAWTSPASDQPIYCLSAESGKELWRTGSQFDRDTKIRPLCDVTGDGYSDVLLVRVSGWSETKTEIRILDGRQGSTVLDFAASPTEYPVALGRSVMTCTLPKTADRPESALAAMASGSGAHLWIFEIGR